MRTLVVRGRDALPSDLRAMIQRGSTSVDEVSTAELSTFVSREGLGVDRLIFWAGDNDRDVRALALNYSSAAGSDRAQTVVFVTRPAPTSSDEGDIPGETFIWPRDYDRLRMVLMTAG